MPADQPEVSIVHVMLEGAFEQAGHTCRLPFRLSDGCLSSSRAMPARPGIGRMALPMEKQPACMHEAAGRMWLTQVLLDGDRRGRIWEG